MRIDSLNKKTILLIFIVVIVCISGSVFMISQIIEKQAMNKYKTDKKVSIEVLSYSLAPMMVLYDYKQVEHLITLSLKNDLIVSIMVFDNNGTLIKSSAKQNFAVKELSLEKREITTSLKGIIGSLEIGFSKKYINDRIRTVRSALIFGLMGGLILLGLGLYTLMRRYIIEPLESLTKTVKEMNFENLSSRVKIYRKDEIGTLATSFNQMADNLEKSHRVLHESESKYRSMMEAMNDAVYICSPDFKIEYMNPAMVKMIGVDAMGKHCFKTIFDLDKRCPWCQRNKIQQGKSLSFDVANPQDDRFYHVSNAAIAHSNGTISVLAVLRDTTKFKSLEIQLLQAQKMESIGTLAAGIAHDFNNILSGIFGYAQLTEMNIDDSEKTKIYIGQIVRGAQRASTLVQQILTFSRKTEYEKQPLRISITIKEALKLLRASIPSTIEIKGNVFSKKMVMADPAQIHQAIMNLCTNAFHSMSDTGGVLTVNLQEIEILEQDNIPGLNRRIGGYLRLEISDTGHGIDEKNLNRIFDPYFTTKEVGKGTGLGLALVQAIVDEHNGFLDVDTELNKGTSFYIHFPVIKNTLTPLVPSKKHTASLRGTEKIMFVDDEESIRFVFKHFLENHGYKVSLFKNGIEALKAFEKAPDYFDLIVTDMTMPGLTGDKLSSKFLKIRPDLPIILCTGHSNKISESKAAKIGIKKYVLKPIANIDLTVLIRKIIDQRGVNKN